MSMARRLLLTMPGSGGWATVAAPDAAFSFLPFTIQKLKSTFRVNPSWSIEVLAPTGKAYYVDRSRPNDSGDGLSWATALQDITTALAKSDISELHIAEGIYEYTYGWENSSPNRNIAVYGYGDVIVCPYLPGLSWSAVDSHYTATNSACLNVLDRSNVDENGDWQSLVKKDSEAEVEATAGSWYFEGTTIYVHTFDDREPDADIWPIVYSGNGLQNNEVTYYIENMKFYGGSSAFCTTNTSTGLNLYVNNCEFKYAHTKNGLGMDGGTLCIAKDCVSACNKLDGFKMEEQDGQYGNFIMIDCISRSNGCGVSPADNCNGYSRHDRGSTVIINSEMFNNQGRNIQDVDGAKLWCVSTNNHDSCSITAGADINFAASGADTEMWLDSCISSGGEYDVESGTDAAVYLRNFTGDATNIETGTIADY